jgi:hypothetical protein
MRSIIDGLPPRSGARIFPKTEQVFVLSTSLADFFWRRSPSEYGTIFGELRTSVV